MAAGNANAANGARRTQAERTATAHRRMIRAAISLIARQGYSRTTLAQVGKEAGYTGGLVSHHFGSKRGLLHEVVGRISGRFYQDQIQPAIEGLHGLAALEAMIETYLNELVVRPERMRAFYVLMGEALGPVSEVRDAFAELNRGFRVTVRHWIAAGMASGEIRDDVDPDAEAAMLVAMIRGAGSQWIADPGCFDLGAVTGSLKDAIRRHLAAAEEQR